MNEFNQEYYNTLTEEQKLHYLDDYNLRFTMGRCYPGLTKSMEESKWEN